MDVIYMSDKKIDIGILHNYDFDLAFGSDENDFTCKIDLEDHCCEAGYMLYVEDTEYGGIIDTISPNTEAKTITYGGRTWHGVLEKKILEPEEGEDYLILSGEANTIITELIARIGLTDLFSVSTADSGIEVINYPVRYGSAYTVLRNMLYEFGGKLKVSFLKGYVMLSAVPYVDFSQDEEWDSSQLAFRITKNYRPVNHLICLGKGDLKDRHVIHLFTDENGGLQTYTKADNPVKNEDYILDTSQRLLTSEREVTELYENANAEDTYNYILLEKEPEDWLHTYGDYFQQNENDEFENLESTTEDVYTLQVQQPDDWNTNYTDYYSLSDETYEPVSKLSTTIYTVQTVKPSDWSTNYGSYFTKSSSAYAAVAGVTLESYRKQQKKPSDWGKSYGNYYYYYSDGVTAEYRRVSGNTKYKYVPQTMKPSDWSGNYKNYYKKGKAGNGYTAVSGDKAPAWKAKRYFTKESESVAPKWVKNFYYTYVKTVSEPAWVKTTYYTKGVQSVPTWSSGTYYTKSSETLIPEFLTDSYYERYIDSYADLVEGGIEQLKDSYDCDKISIELNPDMEYDINDVVGANETISGIMVWQPITKKIVKISENTETIEYEIGE